MSSSANVHSSNAHLPPSPDAIIHDFRSLVVSDEKDTTAAQIRAMALVSRLKAMNRVANSATRFHKETTAQSRQEMDQSHLALQNLQYEKRHLEREIEKCRQFASIYQDIPLYSLEDFKRLAPEDAQTEEALGDEHQFMLNRLSFELAERQRLEQRRRELNQQKEELLKSSKSKAVIIDNVKSQIDILIKTAADVQKKVDQLVQPITEATAPIPPSSSA